ncbi:retrovirus-related pol polyprotein from transposon TNT 1-94 [Tanacetum coccineum]|uniref:Retrovirus-related pol polyprotein from transposon TNT 1-94 n=1 Tax=Tanacetum coccineum TaxID=301880 RepID=A0ABQ5F844_9ASTR
MSTSSALQQSPADAGSETSPIMLERGSYIPWASRFRRCLNRNRETRKFLNRSIDKGPYVFKKIQPDLNQPERDETEDDLTGDNLKHYEVVIEYVTSVRLERNVRDVPYDELFYYLQQYEKIVIASRAKKLEKTHDPLALVAHTSSSSSRPPPAYYVTHPPSVVDYDDDYQGDTFQNDPEDTLTSAMMLLACAITQRYSTPTNNHLQSSSNTRNQAVVQADRVNIQSRNVGNDGRIGYNCSAKGHYARDCTKPIVRDSKYFMEQMLLAKKDEAGVILSNETK